jgi:double-strand break repair protein MRE11
MMSELMAQEGALCALDVLSVSGVLNYFGKLDLAADEAAADPTDQGIRIKPILLRKGTTNLAMYGVGNVKDARMHYELRSNRVKMFMPEGGEVGEEDWFNILLVHQNRSATMCALVAKLMSRVKHGPQQSVPEGMFDDSVKLVVWGHEHDCRLTPEKVEGKDYYISQPGSSVATSLAPGESIPKYVPTQYPRILLISQTCRYPICSRISIPNCRNPFEDGPTIRNGRGGFNRHSGGGATQSQLGG